MEGLRDNPKLIKQLRRSAHEAPIRQHLAKQDAPCCFLPFAAVVGWRALAEFQMQQWQPEASDTLPPSSNPELPLCAGLPAVAAAAAGRMQPSFRCRSFKCASFG